MKYLFGIILSFMLLIGCSVKPEPIVFGKDQCHFCRMNIVDQQHAAQLVSKKGKQFKFDAIECMLNHLSTSGVEAEIQYFLVSDFGYSNLVNANEATFLISKNIKSPMGANLSAFSSVDQAIKTKEENTGNVYSWEEIKVKFDID